MYSKSWHPYPREKGERGEERGEERGDGQKRAKRAKRVEEVVEEIEVIPPEIAEEGRKRGQGKGKDIKEI